MNLVKPIIFGIAWLGCIRLGIPQTSLPQLEELKPPLCLTAEEDRRNMMDQLGIQQLRPGKSGSASDANPANYDESKANPFKVLPDPLISLNGAKITSPELWWNTRRPEIAEVFEKEVYGRIPGNVPEIMWEVVLSEREYIGWTPVNVKKVIGRVDNSGYPLIDVNISMVVVTPANIQKPVPLLMMFGPAELPAPVQPAPKDFAKINEALRKLLEKDPEIKEILQKYPAYDPLVRPQGVSSSGYFLPVSGEPPATHQLIGAGWGYALIDPVSIQPDNAQGLTCDGIIALTNKGGVRQPDDWGALRAWAWGASRGLDFLETDPAIDAGQVGIEGVSRFGKAAMVAMAFDERFALGLIGSSGKGGATLHRRNFGEGVENLTGGFHYWMAGNYLKYGAQKGKWGEMSAADLPVDSHQLIAMCAPRMVFISYGIPEQGDANWLDHYGSYMAAVAAGPVYKLLGALDLGVSNDYWKEKMPGVNAGLLEGRLAWRQHDGGHTDLPNIFPFINWVNRHIGYEEE